MAPIRKNLTIKDNGPLRAKGRSKKTWMVVVKINMKKCNLFQNLVQDRLKWKNEIRIANFNTVETKF